MTTMPVEEYRNARDLTAQELDAVQLYSNTVDIFTAHRMTREIRRSRALHVAVRARLIDFKLKATDPATVVQEIIRLMDNDTDERLNLRKEQR